MKEDQNSISLAKLVADGGDDCGFDWQDERNIVVHRQPLTAIYRNHMGQVVIRQQGDCFRCDEDPFLVISQEHLAAVIDALKAMLNG